ncbi:hypothetical protein P154DRAFT_224961 [Amniculicola lignicola CBS 123094]|uniref:Uncharacterized protein n=1 Tax=Amniculicola lignicola CBS 123094 TaxID=1392246 RepID=A0A6A5X1F7_9PLEO|nr:hypothetical protein P154DRAFT_224961 [Amniculicola lignicola CBS 123094]
MALVESQRVTPSCRMIVAEQKSGDLIFSALPSFWGVQYMLKVGCMQRCSPVSRPVLIGRRILRSAENVHRRLAPRQNLSNVGCFTVAQSSNLATIKQRRTLIGGVGSTEPASVDCSVVQKPIVVGWEATVRVSTCRVNISNRGSNEEGPCVIPCDYDEVGAVPQGPTIRRSC